MEVLREDVDKLNALLKVRVKPEDYQNKVEGTLQKHRKNAKIPGFRQGHVPMSFIKKQYGKSVLFDEVSKMVSESINKYIAEQKVDLLGNPMPVEGDGFSGDFDNPSDFEFTYEIGLPPKIELSISKKNKFTYKEVEIDDKLIAKQSEDIRRRYGKLESAELVSDKDLVLGKFVELNKDGSEKEGGVIHSASVSLEFLDSEKVRKQFNGKKIGDTLKVNPDDLSKGSKDKAAMLGVKEEELQNVGNKFSFTISEIKSMKFAELNEELFTKLYPDNSVTDEESFNNRIKSDLETMFSKDSDRLLHKVVFEDLMKKVKVNFPEDFLKRWIKQVNEKPITDEVLEKEFEGYLKMLKWQLIEKAVFEAHDIKIEQSELLEFTKGLLIQNYNNYGAPLPDEKELTENAVKFLQDKKQVDSIIGRLAEDKLIELCKKEATLKSKKIQYDDFIKEFK